MLSLNPILHGWLNYCAPSTLWISGDQNKAAAKPIDKDSFGYYTVENMEPLGIGES